METLTQQTLATAQRRPRTWRRNFFKNFLTSNIVIINFKKGTFELSFHSSDKRGKGYWGESKQCSRKGLGRKVLAEEMSAVVVVDVGTACSRIGYSGDVVPTYLKQRTQDQPCAVWRSRVYDYAGVDARLDASQTLADPKDKDVLMIESVSEADSLHYRKRICESLLEARQVKSVCFQYAPVVTCFANARQTGLVLDMSAGGCTASAVLDGWCLTQTNVERSELGGEQIDEWLSGSKNGPALNKEAFKSLDKQRQQRETNTFQLPDGTPISEKVTNALFDPSPFNDAASYTSLHELVFTAATRQTTSEVRRALLNNIVLCGGLSRTEGVSVRLANELNTISRMDNPRVVSCGPEQRSTVSWIGGSILGSLPVYKEITISRQEYQEGGINAVFKKCA